MEALEISDLVVGDFLILMLLIELVEGDFFIPLDVEGPVALSPISPPKNPDGDLDKPLTPFSFYIHLLTIPRQRFDVPPCQVLLVRTCATEIPRPLSRSQY